MMRLKFHALIVALVVCGTYVSAQAQQSATDVQVVPASTPVAAVPASATNPAPAAPAAVAAPAPSEASLVTLDFQDADIRNVLKVLAYKSGVNIVAGPEVTGVVSIQLTDVPWQKALDVILSTYGYGYDRKGNIITVTTIEILKKRREDVQALADQEPLVTRTFPLNYAKASDIMEPINKIKTARGSINFDQRTNMIIVRDVQSNLDLIDGVIKSLDSATPQVLIEAKVLETTLSNTENLGIDWGLAASVSGATQPTSFPFTVPANQYKPAIDPTNTLNNVFKYGTLDASGLTATLDVLNKRTNTHVLSNPSIVTVDNSMAKIVVGSQYPIPQYTYNADQAKLQLSGWNYMDIGIIFEVTPHVNNAGLVTLDLQPTITAITDYVLVDPAATAKVPVLSTEQAKTKVMVKDGQTLVIAGLIKSHTTITKKKVPFLGDIPFFGAPFRDKADQLDKTEILIFLTPRIITVSTSPAAASDPSGKK